MRIAICGPGLVGSYLYRLLSQAGIGPVSIFGNPAPVRTSCGIHPCAWGTSLGFEELIAYGKIDPTKYILQRFDNMSINGMKVKAKSMVINKPKLVVDLLNGAQVLNLPIPVNGFDRIIDATGFTRAFLPPTQKDLIISCVQYRVSIPEKHDLSIDISNLGYAWRFPISRNEYHIGAGSIARSPQKMLENLGWLKSSSPICSCTGKIRLTAPHFSLPFVDLDRGGQCPVWGTGEAIGCVAPLIGEGIIPGLKSARLLLANWENPDAYREAILKEFSWMKDERKVVDKASQGQRPGLFDAKILKHSAQRFNMDLDYNQGLYLLRSLVRME